MYARYIKRLFDFVLSFIALVLLSPFLLILTMIGTIAMKGNPFFIQPRPGKKDKNGKEKIFNMIKFRTMSNKKDKNGNFLPDEQRLTKYGKFLRSTSLDELPEFINVLKGDMSLIGPRPLLVKYLPLYNENQKKRHDVRPGITGLAQINGRNTLNWEDKFEIDIEYINNITLINDIKIFVTTIVKVLKREGINNREYVGTEEFRGTKKDKEYVK